MMIAAWAELTFEIIDSAARDLLTADRPERIMKLNSRTSPLVSTRVEMDPERAQDTRALPAALEIPLTMPARMTYPRSIRPATSLDPVTALDLRETTRDIWAASVELASTIPARALWAAADPAINELVIVWPDNSTSLFNEPERTDDVKDKPARSLPRDRNPARTDLVIADPTISRARDIELDNEVTVDDAPAKAHWT